MVKWFRKIFKEKENSSHYICITPGYLHQLEDCREDFIALNKEIKAAELKLDLGSEPMEFFSAKDIIMQLNDQNNDLRQKFLDMYKEN